MKLIAVVMVLSMGLAPLVVAGNIAAARYFQVPNVRAAYPYVYGAHSSSLVTPTQVQYQSQDDLGQYSYGYSEPLSTKQEVRSLDGIVRGSYSYIDADGKLQSVGYTADNSGFHVAATNLPRDMSAAGRSTFRTPETAAAPQPDTGDIAAAARSHTAADKETELRLANYHAGTGNALATNTGGHAVELSNAVEDTRRAALAPNDAYQLRPRAGQTFQIATTIPVAPTVIPVDYPAVYQHYNPFLSRFVQPRYHF